MESIINTLNPANTNWSDSAEAIQTGLVYLVLVVLFITLLIVIKNFRSIRDYLRQMVGELYKVDWASRAHTLRLTGITIVFIIGSTLFIYAVDQVFFELRNIVLPQ